MSAHTPGPWDVLPLGDGAIVRAGKVQFGRALGSHAVNMSEPDARLIAAAPDMLAALRKVPLFGPTKNYLGWRCAGCGRVSGIHPDGTHRHEVCEPDCYVPTVEAAIAKAEGQS